MAEPLQQAMGGIDAVAPRAPAARPHPQLLRLGVSLALLALLLLLVDLETVWGVIAKARPELLALMFACCSRRSAGSCCCAPSSPGSPTGRCSASP